jgi:hypothetical protein
MQISSEFNLIIIKGGLPEIPGPQKTRREKYGGLKMI